MRVLSIFVTKELVIYNLVHLRIAGKLLELNVGRMLKRICEEFKKHDLERDYKKLKDHKTGSGSDRLPFPIHCTSYNGTKNEYVLFGREIYSKCGKKLNDLNVHSFLMVSVSAEKLPV